MTRSVVLVTVTLWAGCGGCDSSGPSGPRTEIVSPGDGPPNTESLWPLHAGSSYRAINTSPFQILGPEVIDGREVFRFVNERRESGFTGTPPNEPAFVKYLANSAEGVLYVGQLREGVFAAPVLLVPSEVRLGMKWISRTDADDPRFTFEVTDRTIAPTVYGMRTRWTIKVEDHRVITEMPPATYSVTYVEGRGPIKGLPFNTNMGLDFSENVVMLDDDGLPPRAAQNLPLSPLNGGAPILDGVFADNIAFIAGATHFGGALEMTIFGRRPELVAADPDGGVGYGDVPFLACGVLRNDKIEAPPDDGCLDGRAGYVEPSGALATIPSGPGGIVVPPSLPCTPGDCFTMQMRAIHPDPQGAIRVLADQGMDRWYFGAWDPAAKRDDIKAPMFDLFGFAHRLAYDQTLFLAREDADGVAVGIPVPGALGFGRMPSTHVETGTRVELAREAPITTTISPGVVDWLHAMPDGRIDRLRLDKNGISSEALADVALPPDSFVVGAGVVDGKLVVATQSKHHGYDNQYDETGKRHLRIEPDVGGVYLWQAALPSAAPVARAPSITAIAIGHDVRVCAPPAIQLPLSGWTIGGEEPATVVPAGLDGLCVVIVRKALVLTGLPGEFAVEGNLPGAGHVALTVPLEKSTGLPGDNLGGASPRETAEQFVLNTKLAPLAGGGVVSPTNVYGPGLTLAHSIGESMALSASVVDARGAGIWYTSSSPTRAPYVALVGRDTKTFDIPGTGVLGISGRVLGQGVIVSRDGVLIGVLHPDGTIAPVQSQSGFVYTDGTDVVLGSIDCGEILGGNGTKVYGLTRATNGAYDKLCIAELGSVPSKQEVPLGSFGFNVQLAFDFVQAADGAAYLYQVRPPPSGTNYRHILISIDNALTSTTNLIEELNQPLVLGSSTQGRIVADRGVFDILPMNPVNVTPPTVIRVPR